MVSSLGGGFSRSRSARDSSANNEGSEGGGGSSFGGQKRLSYEGGIGARLDKESIKEINCPCSLLVK